MSFLQPWMLMALPLIAIPIVIHLINQRRFQTVPWAAMMFLLNAAQMSSGYTKLRQWLILAMRTLAIAGLIFFTARPLTSGILGLLAGNSDSLAVIIIDRSPSMQEKQPGSGSSKLDSAVAQLTDTMKTLGIGRIAMVDGMTETPREFNSISQWTRDNGLHGLDATTDIPGLMEQALAYIKNNRSGSTHVWLCSDMRESDWRSRDGRWPALNDAYAALPQDIRFSILDMGAAARDNRSIRVTSARRVSGTQGPELLLSFRIEQATASSNSDSGSTTAVLSGAAVQIPVEIEVGTARSVLNVDLQGEFAEIADMRIPLEQHPETPEEDERGWGLVRIPGDANLADNTSYFTFQTPPKRRTVIVSDNPNIVASIELCAAIAPEQSIQCETETISAAQLDAVDWNTVAMLVWHDQLPDGKSLATLEQFVGAGGQLLLLPPESPTDAQAFGVQWLAWETLSNTQSMDNSSESATDSWARVQQWQNDSELLANTVNGAPLPVGQIAIKRVCRMQGGATPLAVLSRDVPLLMRIDRTNTGASNTNGATDAAAMPGTSTNPTPSPSSVTGSSTGGIYVFATTPSTRDSTLAVDGIVLYVSIQRILNAGSQRIGTAKIVTVGQAVEMVADNAVQEAGDKTVLSNEYALHTGVYRTEKQLVAQNRQLDEDSGVLVADTALDKMFRGLSWSRIGVESDSTSLVQEIWRWFVILMLGALLLEAILCMPQVKKTVVPRRLFEAR